jgi:hypothetical protein
MHDLDLDVIRRHFVAALDSLGAHRYEDAELLLGAGQRRLRRIEITHASQKAVWALLTLEAQLSAALDARRHLQPRPPLH